MRVSWATGLQGPRYRSGPAPPASVKDTFWTHRAPPTSLVGQQPGSLLLLPPIHPVSSSATYPLLTCHTLAALKSVTPAPGTLSQLSRQDQEDMGKEAETRAASSSASPLSGRELVRLCTPRALEGRLTL